MLHNYNSTTDYDSQTSSAFNHVTKKSKTLLTKKKRFLDLANDTIMSLNTQPVEEDECTVVGKRFAMQLRGMAEQQRILAEKIVSDVMYYGRMGKLTEDSFKFNFTNKINLNNGPSPHTLVYSKFSQPLLNKANHTISQVPYEQHQYRKTNHSHHEPSTSFHQQ